jgi:pimeloyl-ACP methyl ester carboxylesterase
MTRRRNVLVAAAVALTMGVAGCSSQSGPGTNQASSPQSGTPQSRVARTPPPGAAALARFYGQTLAWRGCGNAQCAGLSVPLDYAQPAGATITVQVLRMTATRPSERIGSLVVNPGGPGGSGVDYARAADQIVGAPVRQRFDIVGFDPRGVQRSHPVDCLSDPQMDAFLGQDPTPDTPAEEQAFATSGAQFAKGCVQRTGPLIGHISTEDTARDLDILRSALGDPKLNYLGKSYGTLIGSTYAGLFPKLVGRFVLDGVVPPDATPAEVSIGQAEGFERATRAWAQDCVNNGCPLGSSVDAVMAGVRDLLKRLDAHPVPMTDGRRSQLTEGWAATGIAQAMYDQSLWPTLTEAMRQVVDGNNGTLLMRLADEYADRDTKGHYASNLLEAFYAISCLDGPDSPDLKVYEQRARDASVKAPTWGAFLAWGNVVCGQWPVKEGQGPHTISAAGSGPIVVVGTTRDPATPYEWSVQLRKELANARLLTFDGDGHTAYTRSNGCVDSAIDAYYTTGALFKDGLRC